MSADRMSEPLRDTRYVKELARAKVPSAASKKSSVAIERILVKKSKQVEIRFSWWAGKKMLPKALHLPEEELLPLFATAIEGGVFSEEFTGGLRRLLSLSADPAAPAAVAEDAPELTRVQGHFHALIRSRAGEAVREAGLHLPVLRVDTGTQDDPIWFAIDGMHGGFRYWWDPSAKRLRLMTESWSRVAAGSGQLHEVTASGAQLLGEGFV